MLLRTFSTADVARGVDRPTEPLDLEPRAVKPKHAQRAVKLARSVAKVPNGPEAQAQYLDLYRKASKLAPKLDLDGRESLAASFAQSLPARKPEVYNALADSTHALAPSPFLIDLVDALLAAGAEQHAQPLAEAASQKLSSATRDLADATDKAGRVETRRILLDQVFAGVLPPKESEAGSAAVRASHGRAYAKLDLAEGAAAQDAVLAHEIATVLRVGPDSPDFAKTLAEKGVRFLGQLNQADRLTEGLIRALNEPHPQRLVDRINSLGGTLGTAHDVDGILGSLLVEAVGARAMALLSEGRGGEAKDALGLLSGSHLLFGIPPEQMKDATAKLQQVMTAKGDAVQPALAEFRKSVGDVDADGMDALHGLSIALALPRLVARWADLPKETARQRIQTLQETFGSTNSAGHFALKFLRQSPVAHSLGEGFTAAGSVSGLIGAFLNAEDAEKAWYRRDYYPMAKYGIASASTADLAINASHALTHLTVPGGGIATGAQIGLTVAGLGDGVRHHVVLQMDSQRYLQGAGLSAESARILAPVSGKTSRSAAFSTAVAKEKQLFPSEVFAHVAKLPPDAQRDVMKLAKRTELSGKKPKLPGPHRKGSLADAVKRMDDEGFLPNAKKPKAYKKQRK